LTNKGSTKKDRKENGNEWRLKLKKKNIEEWNWKNKTISIKKSVRKKQITFKRTSTKFDIKIKYQ
jgi:hypothetical protein